MAMKSVSSDSYHPKSLTKHLEYCIERLPVSKVCAEGPGDAHPLLGEFGNGLQL
jgi:hypothetical protein